MGRISKETIIHIYGSEEVYKEYIHQKLSGKHFWTNGVDDRKFSDDETPPDGWWRGRTHSGRGTRGYVFINDGTHQTQIPKDSKIPEGYKLGALSFTKEHKQGISKALKQHKRSDEHAKHLYDAHQTEEYKNRLRETNLEKYGVSCVFELNSVKEKIKKTCLEKYGVEYSSSSSEIRERVRETCLNKYGVSSACMLPQCKLGFSNDSQPNKDFAKLLEDSNIEYEREFPLDKYSYDFKVGNILIEIDPTSTHNSTWGIFGNDGIDKHYHQNKSKVALDNGYKCIHIFDWDDKNKIINLLLRNTKSYARKCNVDVVNIKNTNEFLNKYHIQGTCKGQKISIGLYEGSELVSLMTFGKPRYNHKYEYELLRYCSSKNIVGGANKIFTEFLNKYNPSSIISYCDMSKFKGDVYDKLGFMLDKNNIEPSKHWYNLKTHIHITDNLLRQCGYDQLFGTSYGKGTSNDELMLNNGFVEIYDCGQSSYIWRK